jgi:hypothetical protein
VAGEIWCLAPCGVTKDIITRMIAYRIQEEAFGCLNRQISKLLDRLARGDSTRTDLNRRLKAGTVLIREYQGERHTVTVVLGGFVWQGTTYKSLSTIARAITGTAWNGPRFFGLRPTGDRESSKNRTAPHRAGRLRRPERRRTAHAAGG